MYEWSAQQKNILLITGHTHQPVFESLTHPEKLYKELLKARSVNDISRIQILETEIQSLKKRNNKYNEDVLLMKPSYFNSGCCCFSDGDITGIEITHEKISLIKWSNEIGREILEATSFNELIAQLK
jgi:hypothetical protein